MSVLPLGIIIFALLLRHIGGRHRALCTHMLTLHTKTTTEYGMLVMD